MINLKRFNQKSLAIFFGLFFLVSGSVLAKGRKAPDAEVAAGPLKVDWIKDGERKNFSIVQFDLKKFISVDELARISSAQIRWQPASKQVCLNRVHSLVCFDWSDDSIYRDGRKISNAYPIRVEENHAFVDFRYSYSKEFELFSGSDIKWNGRRLEYVQDSPVSLVIPAVENMGDRYRMRLDVSDGKNYSLLEKSPEKIWVRFTRGRSEGSSILEGDDVIQQVRIVQRRKSADMIVRFGKSAKSNHIYLDPKSKELIIEAYLTETRDLPPTPVPVLNTPEEKPALPDYQPVADTQIRTIVIDAGHGGKDPGAVGTRGTYEKSLNLKVAKELASRLERLKNTRVLLTRDSDEFIALADRTKIANNAKADLFVSIHCNSSLSSKTQGFEVYLLSPDATDEAAEAVARVENSVVALEAKNGNGGDKLTNLLASMAVNNYVNESAECAAYMCRNVKASTQAREADVKQANFHVLRGAQMPAVLVELGYLSNPIEELKLRSSRYRSQLVRAIEKGIIEFEALQRKRAQRRHPTEIVSGGATK